jgi:hypothetical protein
MTTVLESAAEIVKDRSGDVVEAVVQGVETLGRSVESLGSKMAELGEEKKDSGRGFPWLLVFLTMGVAIVAVTWWMRRARAKSSSNSPWHVEQSAQEPMHTPV